jgi:hypothetical protein
MKNIKKLQVVQIVLALLAMGIANFAFLPQTFAGTLTHSSILEIGTTGAANPMIASDPQELAVDFTNATATVNSVSLNFGSWGGTVNATQTGVTSTGCAAYFPGATPATGTLLASGSGNIITVTGLTISSTSNYCLLLPYASSVTNPASAGTYSVTLTAGSDSQIDSIDVLTTGANTYSVTAAITPTFTLTVGSADTFGSALTSGSLNTSTGTTATVSTNAASGWFLYAEDATGNLHSASTGATISSVPTGANQAFTGAGSYGPGHSAYGLAVNSANATANYAYNSDTTAGGLVNGTFNEIASSATAGSGVSVPFKELVNISPTQAPATDYTDTIRIIGAGSF